MMWCGVPSLPASSRVTDHCVVRCDRGKYLSHGPNGVRGMERFQKLIHWLYKRYSFSVLFWTLGQETSASESILAGVEAHSSVLPMSPRFAKGVWAMLETRSEYDILSELYRNSMAKILQINVAATLKFTRR